MAVTGPPGAAGGRVGAAAPGGAHQLAPPLSRAPQVGGDLPLAGQSMPAAPATDGPASCMRAHGLGVEGRRRECLTAGGRLIDAKLLRHRPAEPP